MPSLIKIWFASYSSVRDSSICVRWKWQRNQFKISNSKERRLHSFSYWIKTAEGTRDSHKRACYFHWACVYENILLRNMMWNYFIADLESSLGFYLFGLTTSAHRVSCGCICCALSGCGMCGEVCWFVGVDVGVCLVSGSVLSFVWQRHSVA